MDCIVAKISNFDLFEYFFNSMISNPESYNQDSIRNLMLISIARSLASIADKMNETK